MNISEFLIMFNWFIFFFLFQTCCLKFLYRFRNFYLIIFINLSLLSTFRLFVLLSSRLLFNIIFYWLNNDFLLQYFNQAVMFVHLSLFLLVLFFTLEAWPEQEVVPSFTLFLKHNTNDHFYQSMVGYRLIDMIFMSLYPTWHFQQAL